MKLKHNILIFQITHMTALMLIIFLVVGISTVKTELDENKNDAQSIAYMVAEHMNGDEVARYKETLQTDDRYDATKRELKRVKEKFPDARYLYVFAPIDENHVVYIYDIYTEADVLKYKDTGWELGYTEEWDLTKGNIGSLYTHGIIEDSLEVENTEFGFVTSRYAKVLDSRSNTVAYVGVDYDLGSISINLLKTLVRLFIVIACFSALVIIAEFEMMKKKIVAPIKHIEVKAAQFAESDHNLEDVDRYFCDVDESSKNEINILAKNINNMMKDIDGYIDVNNKITSERERIGTELMMAGKIQSAMLPREFPTESNYKLYASMDPAKEVGGDFYDFFMLDDTHLAMVIADVSGKGVAAALFMTVSKILLDNYLKYYRTPANALRDVNNRLCTNNDADMFVTVWMGVLDLETGIITASNAGHEYPAIKEANGEYKILKDKHGFVLGGMPDMQYTDYEIKLNPGDEIFVYTDGVAEATNSDMQLFGTDNMLAALNTGANKDPKTTISNVKAAIDTFVGDAVQFDDITMLNVVYMGSQD